MLLFFQGPGGCPGFPCYNGGSCFTDDSGTRCSCPDPNLGVHCEGAGSNIYEKKTFCVLIFY